MPRRTPKPLWWMRWEKLWQIAAIPIQMLSHYLCDNRCRLNRDCIAIVWSRPYVQSCIVLRDNWFDRLKHWSLFAIQFNCIWPGAEFGRTICVHHNIVQNQRRFVSLPRAGPMSSTLQLAGTAAGTTASLQAPNWHQLFRFQRRTWAST